MGGALGPDSIPDPIPGAGGATIKGKRGNVVILEVLRSELDARLADIAAGSHSRQEQGFRDICRNRGSLWTWATLGLAHTPSVIALGCLDGGDKRGEGQGLLLESTRL